MIEEYSTLKPATNSASASGKSKGALLVSANMAIRKRIAEGKKGKRKETYVCAYTIEERLNELAAIRHGKIIKVKAIS